jgi:hypothetical protein
MAPAEPIAHPVVLEGAKETDLKFLFVVGSLVYQSVKFRVLNKIPSSPTTDIPVGVFDTPLSELLLVCSVLPARLDTPDFIIVSDLPEK